MNPEEQQRIEANIAACKAALADPRNQLQLRTFYKAWGPWGRASIEEAKPFYTAHQYRLKPEPAVIYCNEYPGALSIIGHTTPDEARRAASSDVIRTAVRFVEAPEGGGE